MSEIRVRPALPEEAPRTAEIAVAAYQTDGLLDEDNTYEAHLRDADSRFTHADVLVAVDDADEVLGSVTVARAGTPFAQIARDGELEFRMLSTAPAARGRGVGELLTRAVVDRARESGCRRVVLCVVDRNANAIRLYLRLGFVRLPGRDWSPVPDIRLTAYTLDLG